MKAYDAATGEHRWTTYTIPGPGEPGNETWPGDTWKNGGGPTWTTGVFDPELNLVYWNTGNAAPWNCHVRKGDNQWTAATIAIDPDDGSIRWGFQYTPWDCWDYDAVSTPVLADVTLPGHGPVKALFHHDKNGFLLRARPTDGASSTVTPIVPGINWAHGLDPETRPTRCKSRDGGGVGRPRGGTHHPEPRRRDRLAAAGLQPESPGPLFHVEPVGDGLPVLGGGPVRAADARRVVPRRGLPAVPDEREPRGTSSASTW